MFGSVCEMILGLAVCFLLHSSQGSMIKLHSTREIYISEDYSTDISHMYKLSFKPNIVKNLAISVDIYNVIKGRRGGYRRKHSHV